MKKIIAACAALAVYKLASARKAEAWFSDTHEDITQKALDLLVKEGKNKQAAFFKAYHKDILEGCTEPDLEDDIDCGAGWHYYSGSTPKGKELKDTKGWYRNRLGKFAKSARTALEENYTSAPSLYKSGKANDAMHVLGRAAHFIEDMCCTVHTANCEYDDKPTNLHYAYEKNINGTCVKYKADRFDKRLLKIYSGDSFENAANKLVKAAAKFVTSISSLDPVAFGEAAGTCLPMAQQNVMALFLKFYDDCKADKGNYIADGRKYSFKNEASGLMLTVSDKQLTFEKPDKNKDQRFTAELRFQGAFSFKASDGSYIGERFRETEEHGRSSLPEAFRLAALGDKRFRLMTGSSEYTKAVGITKSGTAAVNEFDPADKTQVWVLI